MTARYRPRVDVLARNVLAAYAQATDAERADGRAWYADARELAAELDPTDIERAAAVIAVLSPRQSWDGNVKLARRAYADGRLNGGTLGDIVVKVNQLLGATPYAWRAPADVVSGRKVTSFWRNILGDPDIVTIDRHAYDLARGKAGEYERRGATELARVGVYDAFCDAYRRAAAELADVTAAELQAVTWCAWRRYGAIGTGRRARVAA